MTNKEWVRFINLGKNGANADVKHKDRKEWEELRDKHNKEIERQRNNQATK